MVITTILGTMENLAKVGNTGKYEILELKCQINSILFHLRQVKTLISLSICAVRALVALWVKCWPADLVVPSLIPGNLFNSKQGPFIITLPSSKND